MRPAARRSTEMERHTLLLANETRLGESEAGVTDLGLRDYVAISQRALRRAVDDQITDAAVLGAAEHGAGARPARSSRRPWVMQTPWPDSGPT